MESSQRSDKISAVKMEYFIKHNSLSNTVNFSYSFRPIHLFSRLFGLLPFTIVYGPNGDAQEARVTAFDILWFIISVFFYLIFTLHSLIHMQMPSDPNQLPLLIHIEYAILIVRSIFSSVIIIFDMCNRSTLIDILKKFTTFDMEVI